MIQGNHPNCSFKHKLWPYSWPQTTAEKQNRRQLGLHWTSFKQRGDESTSKANSATHV